MRRIFADELYKQMKRNQNIYLLVGDLGYKVFDKHFKDFPERCFNCGAAEQAMMDIACGLAIEGKIPVVYSITTFLLYRPFETLRTYINHEKLNVKLIGSGRNKDYAHDGISHWANDAISYLHVLHNIQVCFPDQEKEIPNIVRHMIAYKKPYFLSLRR